MSDPIATEPEDYNVGLHIGGLFAILGASSLGVLFPIIFTYSNFSAETTLKLQKVIQVARTFGSGVILATAFIHMLPSAFADLTDPSLPETFQEGGYGAWAGLIALLSALLLHLLEFVATQRFFNMSKEFKERNQRQREGKVHSLDRLQEFDDLKAQSKIDETDSMEEGHVGHAVDTPNLERADSCVHVSHVHGGEILLVNKANQPHHHHHHHQDTHSHSNKPASINGTLNDDELVQEKEKGERRARQIGTYILEFGIALHSVIIGITLGTTVGQDFISLLIALLFHQFFEGVALGSRIASLKFSRKSISPWVLSAWFALSTPLGNVIGIAIRSSYEGGSVKALIIQGVFDSCSAGILLYTSLAQLLTSDFNANITFRESGVKNQVIQFIALWFGAAAMAVVGKWA